jgi:AcrR family transcriptional regulator
MVASGVPAHRRRAEAAHNDRALLEAARVVFSIQGPGAPVAAIAERAGVGIGSLYRRYASKSELVQALCRASLEEQIRLADDARAVEGSGWDALRHFVTGCVRMRSGALAVLAGTFVPDSETLGLARTAYRRIDGLLSAAQRSGDVRADVAASDVIDIVTLFSRRAEDDSRSSERSLELLLAGLRHAPDRLPGRARSWRSIETGWRSDDS